jgi:ABC-type Fe3+ transport system substrate-binding protein
MTVKEFIESDAQAGPFLKINGFPVESRQFSRMMGIVKLETALSLRKIAFEQFSAEFEKFVQSEAQINATIGINDNDEKAHRIVGSLPCVVQLPLHNAFEQYLKAAQLQIDFQFQGASLGPDWMDRIDRDAPSVVMMAPGFEPLFNPDFLKTYGYDENLQMMVDAPYHPDLEPFRDPKRRLHVISAIPMVLVVNGEVLGERKAPGSWRELASEDYAQSIAYPNEDEDLKNALLLYFYQSGGEAAVARFAQNCQLPLHPSQMVKSRRLAQKPAIMIMPYFFAKIAQKEKGFQVVWPEEGALSIPIFLAADRRMDEAERRALDFFFTEEAGRIFAERGYFPSSVAGVENELLGGLWWLGWDFIHAQDVTTLMRTCCRVFEGARA